jgi:hypothetical protein
MNQMMSKEFLERLSLELTIIAWDGWNSRLSSLDTSRYVEKALTEALEKSGCSGDGR